MKSKPILFSDHFNIDEQLLSKLGIFNPILNFDTKLFVEPLLLKSSSSEIIRKGFSTYNKFFADLMILLQTSQTSTINAGEKQGEECIFPNTSIPALAMAPIQ